MFKPKIEYGPRSSKLSYELAKEKIIAYLTARNMVAEAKSSLKEINMSDDPEKYGKMVDHHRLMVRNLHDAKKMVLEGNSINEVKQSRKNLQPLMRGLGFSKTTKLGNKVELVDYPTATTTTVPEPTTATTVPTTACSKAAGAEFN